MDNYAAHKRVEVRDWLAANPRIHVHFTPTSASWMNLVEVWFGIIERQAIHRGTFGSVRDLNAKIRAFINGWNDRSAPFVWTKTADQVPDQSQPSEDFKHGPLGAELVAHAPRQPGDELRERVGPRPDVLCLVLADDRAWVSAAPADRNGSGGKGIGSMPTSGSAVNSSSMSRVSADRILPPR